MVQVDSSVFIKRPAKDVFDFLVDPDNFTKYVEGAVSAEWTSEPPYGVGSTQVQEMKALGRKMRTVVEITRFASPKELDFKTSGGPMKFDLSHKLEHLDGGTQLTLHMSGEASGFFKLAEGPLASQIQKQFDSDLQRLKSLMEM